MKQAVFDYHRVFDRSLIYFFLIVAALVIDLHGQRPKPEKTTTTPIVNENYKIGPGDVIDVLVTNNDTLSRAGMRVNAEGMVQLPMLDEETRAACQTEKQLAEQIKEKYKKYLVSPYVTVSVREFNANPVALVGAVLSPGRFQIQRPTRLRELLTLVNGPSDKAGRSIEILRSLDRPYCEGGKLVVNNEEGEEQELISISLADTLKGVEGANPLVRAGDLIWVVEADQVNAYIQGSVRSSLTVNLKDPVTLSQAVAMAGGLAPGAAADKIIIRRSVPNSINRNAMIVNLKAINQGTIDDVLLQANDIVEVPGPSGAKKFFTQLYETLVPTVLSLPMRVIY